MPAIEKHDVYDETTLNDPILAQLTTRANALEKEDIDRGAIGPAQVPPFIFALSPGHTVSGGHEAVPVGDSEYFGFEDYDNAPREEVHPGDAALTFPAFNYAYPVASGTGPMRTLGTNAPYGADNNDGWSVVARTNLSTPGDCAEITVSPTIDLDVDPDLSAGRLEFDLSAYLGLGVIDGTAGGPAAKPPIGVAFGVSVNNVKFILPRSIDMYSIHVSRDIFNMRYTCTIADIVETIDDFFGASAKQLSGFFVAVYFNDAQYTEAQLALGNWGFSVWPAMRGDF
jgi:hypothetical protein